jgi:two-component sensor histidine kinase/CHASE3 domain sensor protein
LSNWSARFRLRPPAVLLLAIVALGLVGSVALILSAIKAEQAHREQVGRVNEVIVLLHDISRDAVNAETGQRGYFITLDNRYLAPYQAAHERMRRSVDRLKTLAAEAQDPARIDLANSIEQLVAAKFADLDKSVALVRNGDLVEARRQILTDEGQQAMERLRVALGRLERIERGRLDAALGQAVDSENRIVPLLLSLLVLILLSLGLGISLALRNADAEARAANAAELAAARDRADLLAHELNHRVKNLFAVVLAIVQMSARGSPEARPVIERVGERIRALLKAHEVTQGPKGPRQAELKTLIETVLSPYRSEATHCGIDGPPLVLTPQQATPLGLMLHELVTNAVKYGAWSKHGGELAVTWGVTKDQPPRLDLTWRERCAEAVAPPGDRQGFGGTLLQASTRQLGGELQRDYHADGIEVRIAFPLEQAAPA